MRRSLGLSVVLLSTFALAQTRPATRPTVTRPGVRPAKVEPSPELLALWKDLEATRPAAVALARKVEKDTMEQAKANFKDLAAKTKKFNDLMAPVADASPLRYPSPQPRDGLGRAIWSYKAARAIEKYNDSRKSEYAPEEYEVHRLTNAYREALGLVPLELDPRLIDAARGHSQWMTDSGTFDHESNLPGKKTFDQRIMAAGYKALRAGSENIAFGQETAQQAFDGWFESPGHHHNLVGSYTHLGVGHASIYWTQNFAIGEPTKAGR